MIILKRQRHRFKVIALLLFVGFLLLGLWGIWSVRNYGTRWFSHASNPRLAEQKKNVTEGDIADRNGILLATTVDGKRVYREKSADRAALVHLLGDRNGQIANSVESFQAGYLYGVQSSLLDAVQHLTRKTERRGNNLTLTVDAELCSAIPKAFFSHPLTRGKNGAAVVMNYRTGEVLALVSLPCFDPDQADGETIAALDQPYWNRVTQALLPPGSTFKIVTAAAMLRSLPDAGDRTFTCTGSLQVSDQFTVTEYNHAVHGSVTLRQAFQHSCNTVFASGALELGDDQLRAVAEKFGFNQNFLFRDLVVNNSSYPRRNRTREALAASGYGQSAVTATPMHLCLLSAAVANDGVMMEPRLLKTVKSSAGATVLGWSSSSVCTVCSADVAEALQQMMKDVVQNGGSGSNASVRSMDIRGKTGTAESTSGGQPVNYGWFTGYNAQEELPFALCVLVEDIPEGETGGATAARIAADLFTYLRDHPDRVR